MEFEYFGGNCIRITTKKGIFMVDDNLIELGLKGPTKPANVNLFTTKVDSKPTEGFAFDSPGEYEVLDVSLQGIAARGYRDEVGTKNNTVYRIVADDIRIVVSGHISPDLNDDQLEAIGTVDILFIPVGGEGITLDGLEALKLIKKIEPKIVIPTYYADKGIKYNSSPVDLDVAIKGLSMEPTETLDCLKIKTRDFPATAQLIVLNRQ